MPSSCARCLAGSLLLAALFASGLARADESASYFNQDEIASIAGVRNVGLLKSVMVTGKGSASDVVNLDEVQAFAARKAHEYMPDLRFLDCGSPKVSRDPADNRTPIDCSKRVEDELVIAFQVWTVGTKHYPVAYHLKVTATMTPVGEHAKPQLVVGEAQLGYTKKNRVQGIAESYIDDFLDHFGLQLALAKKKPASGSD